MKLDGPGISLSALLLSVNMFALLREKELITAQEAQDLVSHAIANLETPDPLASPAAKAASRAALEVLESIRDELQLR